MYMFKSGIPVPVINNMITGGMMYIIWIPIIFVFGNIIKTYLFHNVFYTMLLLFHLHLTQLPFDHQAQ
jgi:hypothetical protein